MTRSGCRGAEVGGHEGECLSSCEGCPVTEFMTPQWNIKREGGFTSSWTRNIRPRHRAKRWTESFSTWKSRYTCRNGQIMLRLHTSARSAVKCFRVLSLEHLKVAVTCHATPQGGFQRTGKYRNIEQSRDEGGDSGTTNMSAKEESIQRRHILLSHTFKVDRLIRSQPLSFDVTKHDIWLNNRVRRWWLFLYHMSKVKSRYPVYSVCILKLPLSTFTVLRHKKDKK